MREDFDYIDKTTAVCLTVTPKGQELIHNFMDVINNVFLEVTWDTYPLEDLLLFLEDNYVGIEDSYAFDLDRMYDELVETYKQFTDVEPPDRREIFKKAVYDGLIGFRKCIWG
jgi:hypothetical protein